ncbi:Endonuclease/Exonuclease/phosphatase family protein [Caulifigura coniformis]|uniref:Endonuclease/Exonuclease/phosphatase family protein n=1 Tax=Caulifigura coniformis TaxID=2527983 RepID=A0A517SF98_9PLAN|nr:endonuclease/exonuclease/phosphatase family protein [Caulifigura coniformis]QDT54760.1 Endonuclease/Exonuclease/phosphatase family protein [Caulifigura coniformis]
MQRFVCLLLFGLIVATRSIEAAPPEPLRVMSFNIRYGTAKDGPNHWDLRKDFVVETIKAFKPDLLGTQETLGFQKDFLAEKLPEYTAIGVGRDDGGDKGEMMAIYIRKERLDVVASGHFWLSETPDVVGSQSWDSSLPRMVTWADLQDRQAADRPQIRWFNTHFDHRGIEARKQAGRLLRERLAGTTGKALIVTGDFNSLETSEAYRNLFGTIDGHASPVLDVFKSLPKEKQPTGDTATFSNFRGGGPRKGGRIDWIGVNDRFRVVSAEIDYTERDGRTPSDHFPITTILEWRTPGAAEKE